MNPTLQALLDAPSQYQTVYTQLNQQHQLETPRELGKWSPRFILHHMADIEVLHAWRFLNWLCDDTPTIVPARQNDYPTATNYATRDVQTSLNAFSALRKQNVALLSNLSASELEKVGTHPIRGQFTLVAWLEFIVKHDQSHLEQLRGSLA
jgi:DinB superfamily